MHTPTSPGGRKGRRLPRWPLLVLLAAAAIAAILLTRRGSAPPGHDEPRPTVVRQRSGYENRAVWRAPDEAGARAEAAKLTGTVYDLSGRPVEGAQIGASTFVVAGNQSTEAASAQTDRLGRFELRLADGSYYLAASKEGYSPGMVMANTGEDIGIILQKGGAVTGHVYDERKEPIKDFAIDVIAPAADDMAAPAPYFSKRFTSADGSFQIDGIPGSGVFVRATASQRAPAVSEMITVAAGETKTVDLTLPSGCTLSGTVEDEEGSPLSDVLIDAELRRNASVVGTASIDATSQAESDAQGRFTLEHVSVGEVLVRAYDGTHAVSSTTLKIEKCDGLEPVKLQMTQGSTLSGLVQTSDGKPVAGVKISLSNRAVGFANTMTDAEGRYHFDKLPPGPMRVQALKGSRRAVALVMVPESGSAERDLPFPAEGKGEIRGRITAAGKPLGGMQLMVVTHQGKGVLDTVFPVTAADGTYSAPNLAAGTYVVVVMSTNRLSPVKLEDGAVETADIDVAVKPEPPKLPDLPKKEEQGEGAPAPADGG